MYLLIVTGMSGAGKSTALNALEELGYYCVDNLPSPMLPAFVEMCNNAKPPIERAAVAVDSRESLLSAGPEDAVDVIKNLPCRYEIVFLDARDEVLRERYNAARRRHPLGENGGVVSGVRLERAFLGNMLAHASGACLWTRTSCWICALRRTLTMCRNSSSSPASISRSSTF